MDEYPIERNLVNHPPSKEIQDTMEALRTYYHEVAQKLDTFLVPGREKSLAFTQLEQSLMWAMASLARYDYDMRQNVSLD